MTWRTPALHFLQITVQLEIGLWLIANKLTIISFLKKQQQKNKFIKHYWPLNYLRQEASDILYRLFSFQQPYHSYHLYVFRQCCRQKGKKHVHSWKTYLKCFNWSCVHDTNANWPLVPFCGQLHKLQIKNHVSDADPRWLLSLSTLD